jgi:mannose-6-phosphate isomerase-like protein (cupin superfamily)
MESMENPVIGEKITFLTTSKQSNGNKSLMEIFLSPKGGNPLHYHKRFHESFKIIEGELNVQVGKEIKILKPGDTTIAPLFSQQHKCADVIGNAMTTQILILPKYFNRLQIKIH